MTPFNFSIRPATKEVKERQEIFGYASKEEYERTIMKRILEHDFFVRLSASEVACYRWPEDTAEHRAMRAAFCDGAAHEEKKR